MTWKIQNIDCTKNMFFKHGRGSEVATSSFTISHGKRSMHQAAAATFKGTDVKTFTAFFFLLPPDKC